MPDFYFHFVFKNHFETWRELFIKALLIFADSTMFYYDLEDRRIETFLIGRRK